MLGEKRVFTDLNLNPPCILPFLQALSHLSLQRFGLVWTIVSYVLLFGTVLLILWCRPETQRRQIAWFLLCAPIMDTLIGSQIYFGLFLLAALALVLHESGHNAASAIAIGLLVAIKPTMIFWILFLYLAGHRQLALRSLATTSIVSVSPLLLYPPNIYREWVQALAHDPHWQAPTNVAIPAFFARLGMHSFGFALAAILAALLARIARKAKPEMTTVSGIALCAGILCAPLGWNDYVLFAAPFFVARRWDATSNVAAALMMVPAPVVMVISASPPWWRVALGSGIYFAAVLLVLASFTWRASGQFRKRELSRADVPLMKRRGGI
jgi:hypothetical protein